MFRLLLFSGLIATTIVTAANKPTATDVYRKVSSGLTSSGTPIDILAPADSGLALSDIEVDASREGFKGGSYKIRNTGGKTVVAFVVDFDLYWGSSPEPKPVWEVEDSRFLNAPGFKPGESKDQLVSTSIIPANPTPLACIKAYVDYVEFEDGTHAGADLRGIASWLAQTLSKEQAIQRELAASLNSGVPMDVIVNEINQGMLHSQDQLTHLAYATLNHIYAEKGPGEFASKILEPQRSLKGK